MPLPALPAGFRTSSSCTGGQCVAVDIDGAVVRVGDTKDPTHVLAFTRSEWAAFVAGVKNGEFDLP